MQYKYTRNYDTEVSLIVVEILEIYLSCMSFNGSRTIAYKRLSNSIIRKSIDLLIKLTFKYIYLLIVII